MKVPLATHRAVLALLLALLANVVAVSTIQPGSVRQVLQDAEEESLHPP
jgi:hypothetical protein